MDYQQENEQLKQRIQELETALQAAQRQITELTALLNQNSHNSHWLSSRDKSHKQKKETKSLRGCHRARNFYTIRSYLSTIRKQGVSIWSALGSLFSGDILMPDLIPV